MQLVILVTKSDVLLSGLFISFCQHGFHTGLHFFSQQLLLLFKLFSEFVEALFVLLVNIHEFILLDFLQSLYALQPLPLHLFNTLLGLLLGTLQQTPLFLQVTQNSLICVLILFDFAQGLIHIRTVAKDDALIVFQLVVLKLQGKLVTLVLHFLHSCLLLPLQPLVTLLPPDQLSIHAFIFLLEETLFDEDLLILTVTFLQHSFQFLLLKQIVIEKQFHLTLLGLPQSTLIYLLSVNTLHSHAQFLVYCRQLFILLSQSEYLALSFLGLLLALFEAVKVIVELRLQVFYFSLQLALRKSQQLVGLSKIVNAFLLLLVQDTVLLQLEATFLLATADVFQSPFQLATQIREEGSFRRHIINIIQLVFSHTELLQQSDHLQLQLEQDLFIFNLEQVFQAFRLVLRVLTQTLQLCFKFGWLQVFLQLAHQRLATVAQFTDLQLFCLILLPQHLNRPRRLAPQENRSPYTLIPKVFAAGHRLGEGKNAGRLDLRHDLAGSRRRLHVGMSGFGLGRLGKEGLNWLLLLRLWVLALTVDLFYLVTVECLYFFQAILSALGGHFFLRSLSIAHGWVNVNNLYKHHGKQ